jgi:hypothetical protein
LLFPPSPHNTLLILSVGEGHDKSKHMKRIITSLLLLYCVTGSAQTPADSVRSVIASLFTAMYNGDAQTMKGIFHDSAMLGTVMVGTAGETVYRNDRIAGFISQVGQLQKGVADERAVVEQVMVDGPLAMAWVPYSFHYNGKFSHCGVNLMQLVRTGGGWKILTITDTRRKSPCG